MIALASWRSPGQPSCCWRVRARPTMPAEFLKFAGAADSCLPPAVLGRRARVAHILREVHPAPAPVFGQTKPEPLGMVLVKDNRLAMKLRGVILGLPLPYPGCRAVCRLFRGASFGFGARVGRALGSRARGRPSVWATRPWTHDRWRFGSGRSADWRSVARDWRPGCPVRAGGHSKSTASRRFGGGVQQRQVLWSERFFLFPFDHG